MWGLFSRDPAKDFGYDIGEKVPGLEDKSVWELHQGKKKGTGEHVSVFTFDVKGSSESQIQLAKTSFKRIKTLRHPNILTFLDGIETDKVIYIATEPVTPLETYLQNNDASSRQNQLAIAWGFHKIAKGLAFLVNDCNLIHNNVCMSSVFVDVAGEWKIGGLDYMYPTTGQDSVPPVKILPYLERYDPPEKSDLRRGIKGEKWSSDMWGFGCLIWEVFNGPLPKTSALKQISKIPKSLVPNYCEVVGANPSSRPNPAKFIESCSKKGGFLNNPFIKTMLYLEEIQIKDPEEKSKFFATLTTALDDFPEQLSRHKVLPQLLNAFEFGNAGSLVLAPLFKVGKLLDHDEYQKKIVPCIVKMFSSTDRTTRVKLLQQIELFIEHIQAPIVNDKIFPNIVSGFMDTNPVVRENTIKAMVYLAPKLNYKNLNEELMKQFARLQAKDDQGGIRTNTTVCLGKIASYMNPQIRQRILCSAFLRAIKDPFPPARQAGIIGMGITQNLFTLADMCHKLMPPLCSMTMDPEKIVRDQAFKAIRGFLQKLEKVSENPELQQEIEKDVLSGGVSSSSAAGWAGWAVGGVSSLTSKIYSKATKKTPTGPGMTGQAAAPPANKDVPKPDYTSAPVQKPEEKEEEDEEEEEDSAGGGGWGDEDWGNMEDMSLSPTASSSAGMGVTTETVNDKGDGWDDDDDNWGSLEEPTNTFKNADSFSSSKSKQSSTSGGSGWGGELSAPSQDSKAAGGALKLGGAKKPPTDSFGWMEEEFSPVEDSTIQPASSYNWGEETSNQDDFFSMSSGTQTKPKSTKSSGSSQSRPSPARSSPARSTGSGSSHSSHSFQVQGGGASTEGGWGSAGGWEEETWNAIDTGESEAEKKKREREEKRQQRQLELQQKREAKKGAGAMKLGAKKMASD